MEDTTVQQKVSVQIEVSLDAVPNETTQGRFERALWLLVRSSKHWGGDVQLDNQPCAWDEVVENGCTLSVKVVEVEVVTREERLKKMREGEGEDEDEDRAKRHKYCLSNEGLLTYAEWEEIHRKWSESSEDQ